MDSSIYFEAVVGSCKEYVEAPGGKKQDVSVVISPLKVTQSGETLKVAFGCNMYKACQNLRCQYSHVSYDNSKNKKPAGV